MGWFERLFPDPDKGKSDDEIKHEEGTTAYDWGLFGAPKPPGRNSLWQQRSTPEELRPWWEQGRKDGRWADGEEPDDKGWRWW